MQHFRWLSQAEIIERLSPEYGSGPVAKMIAWLAEPGVRLIVEKDAPDGRRYRLVHDRLISAVRKVSGQVKTLRQTSSV